MDNLKQVFDIPQCCGFASGQDNKSFYFSGIINPHVDPDPYLIYLDPHYVHEACRDLTQVSIKTFYCSDVRTLRLSKLSSAVALGFYVKNLDDFNDFTKRIVGLAAQNDSVFSVYETSPEVDVTDDHQKPPVFV